MICTRDSLLCDGANATAGVRSTTNLLEVEVERLFPTQKRQNYLSVPATLSVQAAACDLAESALDRSCPNVLCYFTSNSQITV